MQYVPSLSAMEANLDRNLGRLHANEDVRQYLRWMLDGSHSRAWACNRWLGCDDIGCAYELMCTQSRAELERALAQPLSTSWWQWLLQWL